MHKKYLVLYCLSIFLIIACSKDGLTDHPSGQIPDVDASSNQIELADATISWSDEQLKSVESVSDNVLSLASGFPMDKLPKVGQILLCAESTNTFPEGFLGKVKEIKAIGKGYKIVTEKTTLQEAFTRLELNDTIEFISAEERSTRGIEKDGDGFYCFTKGLNLNNENISVSGKTFTGFKMVRKGDFLNGNFECCLLLKEGCEINMAIKTQDLETPPMEIQLFECNFRAVGGIYTTILTPTLKVSFLGELKGNIELGFDSGFSRILASEFKYVNGEFQTTMPDMSKNNEYSFQLNGNLTLKGELFYGLKANVALELLGNEKASIAMEARLGYKEEANLSFNVAEDNLYDQFKDSKIHGELFLGLEFVVTRPNWLLSGKEEYHYPVASAGFFPMDSYLFPEFNLSHYKVNDEKGSVQLASNVNRNLLFHIDIGWVLFSNNQLYLKRTNPVSYMIEEDWKQPLWGEFDGLLPATTYYAYPYLTILGHSIVASEPIVSFTPTDLLMGNWRGTGNVEKEMIAFWGNGTFDKSILGNDGGWIPDDKNSSWIRSNSCIYLFSSTGKKDDYYWQIVSVAAKELILNRCIGDTILSKETYVKQ